MTCFCCNPDYQPLSSFMILSYQRSSNRDGSFSMLLCAAAVCQPIASKTSMVCCIPASTLPLIDSHLDAKVFWPLFAISLRKLVRLSGSWSGPSRRWRRGHTRGCQTGYRAPPRTRRPSASASSKSFRNTHP